MASYSIAEAKDILPTLVDKALAEDVTLTRDGEAAVELRPSSPQARRRPLSEAEWKRLRERRAAHPSLGEDSVSIIRAMGDQRP